MNKYSQLINDISAQLRFYQKKSYLFYLKKSVSSYIYKQSNMSTINSMKFSVICS